MDLNNTNAEKENCYISFDSLGTCIATDFPSSSNITFDQACGGKLSDQNLIVGFKDYSYTNPRRWYSIKGSVNAILKDNSTLILKNPDCNEGCFRTYRRLKEVLKMKGGLS